MSLKTLLDWQRYFAERAARIDQLAPEREAIAEKSPEAMMSILDRYRGRMGA